jgi:hypothetical protein
MIYLSTTAGYLLKTVGLAFMVLGLALSMFGLIIVYAPKEKLYDCSLAEFHPDYPAKVKEECRKMRSSKITT